MKAKLEHQGNSLDLTPEKVDQGVKEVISKSRGRSSLLFKYAAPALLAFVAACGPDQGPQKDSGEPEPTPTADAGTPVEDGGNTDVDSGDVDAGSADGGLADAGPAEDGGENQVEELPPPAPQINGEPNQVTENAVFILTGTTNIDETDYIEVSIDGGDTWETAHLSSDGSWRYDFTFSHLDQVTTFVSRAVSDKDPGDETDPLYSELSNQVTVEYADLTAPEAPTLDNTSETIALNGTATFMGTLPEDATSVQVNAPVAPTNVDVNPEDGTFTVEFADVQNSFNGDIKSADASGNLSTPSAINVDVDSVAPGAPDLSTMGMDEEGKIFVDPGVESLMITASIPTPNDTVAVQVREVGDEEWNLVEGYNANDPDVSFPVPVPANCETRTVDAVGNVSEAQEFDVEVSQPLVVEELQCAIEQGYCLITQGPYTVNFQFNGPFTSITAEATVTGGADPAKLNNQEGGQPIEISDSYNSSTGTGAILYEPSSNASVQQETVTITIHKPDGSTEEHSITHWLQ